jgi:hypothetical protein
MAIINRIAFILLTIISFVILLVLALISPKWYVIYQMYVAELTTKFICQEKGLKEEL